MDEEVWFNVEKIMKRIKPFIGLAVLIFIVVSSISLIEHNKLQREVKESCGYERGDNVFCVCDKNLVSQIDLPNNPYYNKSYIDEALGINGS